MTLYRAFPFKPFLLSMAAAALALCFFSLAAAKESDAPRNDLPNPYRTIAHWGQLPNDRKWGSTAGVDVDRDGVHVWAYDRCGANSCAESKLDPIVEFDASGKAIRSFGAGMFLFPHGLAADKDGNIWVTDQLGNDAPRKGLQVFKFSPEGKLLLTLGKPGMRGEDNDVFGAPTDVLVAPNGDIFVSDGHSGCACPNSRIMKFSADGKFIKAWGKRGTGNGELNDPHALAMDSQGRLFVGDRSNDRIVIFDQDGKFLAAWKQFGRPSGLAIGKDDTLYVADSESRPENNPGVRRGIRIGSAKTGEVKYFIPDPQPVPKGGITAVGTTAAEGVAVDAAGNIYGAEVGPMDLKKYVKQ